MTTKWIEENWWFPWDSAEEAKVEAFTAWLRGDFFEVRAYNGTWDKRRSPVNLDGQIVYERGIAMRPCHPHRALIDQYEPGQEWEVFISIEKKWISVQGVPRFYPEYQYRPKPAKSWQDEFEEWARGKVIMSRAFPGAFTIGLRNPPCDWHTIPIWHPEGKKVTQIHGVCSDWRDHFHEAEEYIEPYTQETLPWPLVIRVPFYNDRDCLILSSDKTNVYLSIGAISYSALEQYKTPTGEPCGIRKWRKKQEAAK